MSLTKFSGATNNIRGLADKPTLSASELKEKFDKTGDDLKTYINETLTTEIETELGEKANSSNVYTKTETDTKYKVNGDFAVLTGTYYNNRFNYPDGFTQSNSVVISVSRLEEYSNGNSSWVNTFYNDNLKCFSPACIPALYPENISIGQMDEGYTYKIVLMKIS